MEGRFATPGGLEGLFPVSVTMAEFGDPGGRQKRAAAYGPVRQAVGPKGRWGAGASGWS